MTTAKEVLKEGTIWVAAGLTGAVIGLAVTEGYVAVKRKLHERKLRKLLAEPLKTPATEGTTEEIKRAAELEVLTQVIMIIDAYKAVGDDTSFAYSELCEECIGMALSPTQRRTVQELCDEALQEVRASKGTAE